ncbi:MAG TPA: class I SAM-dependent methyltransferase [Candidatus Latescibacteria bacterium]|jgi:ubiquinone/menaquinone biosynthesis C-methylase UbiE|nr:class I SAM-dependent methyltransferase [Candidatus Latescibacterota bacterium]HJP29091.1 class I SAM-dependent methyltransferase [Candidatus Latescibacterota bacterium]|tara:strand:- start:166 stop:789 length:624 start_codon:yes stop_codon:yes gene_type:complete
MAPLYASLASLYSGGAIPACQRWAVDRVPVGARVLFVGPGPGTDVVRAAQAGLQVTAIDHDPAMLAAVARRLCRAGAGRRVELIQADLLQRAPTVRYDVVIAQFFLNVFSAARLPGVVDHLAAHLLPGGRLLTGDFGGQPTGRLQQAYHDLPMHLFARLGANAVHGVHDLPACLRDRGFTIRQRRRFRLFRLGPGWIEGLDAEASRI